MNLEIKQPKRQVSARRITNNYRAPVLSVTLEKHNSIWVLSQELHRLAGLDAGYKVNIAQDKDTSDWYVGFSKTGNGQTLRFTGGKYSLVFRHKEAAKDILGDELVYASFLVKLEPSVEGEITWYKILTNSPLYAERKDNHN